MSVEKSELDLILENEKKGIVVFMGIEGAMGAEIKEFIQQPADGILYDLNRDKVTLLSQYSQDNIRWINDYAVAVTITALRAEIERLQGLIARLKEDGENLIQLANFNNKKAVEYCDVHGELMKELEEK